jgi:hypothetical protein
MFDNVFILAVEVVFKPSTLIEGISEGKIEALFVLDTIIRNNYIHQ